MWIGDAVATADDEPARDDAGVAAGMAAMLGRGGSALATPAALALPLTRTAALDRVLAWHDGFVVVREPEAPEGLAERVLESLARLGRPVAVMSPPSRGGAALATAGLVAPPEAVQAVEWLGLGGPGRS